jgi:hypothetical protein
MHGEADAELVSRLHARVAKFFSVQAMTDGILGAYAEARARKAAVSD